MAIISPSRSTPCATQGSLGPYVGLQSGARRRCYLERHDRLGLGRMIRDPLTGETFARVVGRRVRPAIGEVPSESRRAGLETLAPPRTRAPKGVFIYHSHEEMDADRLRWTVEAIVARERNG